MALSNVTRRQFMKTAGSMTLAAGLAVSGAPSAHAGKFKANDKIVLGFIGVGAMGRNHLSHLLKHQEVHVAAAADPDGQRLQEAKSEAARWGTAIDTYTDFHVLIERPDIDAVFVATPDHWHAPTAIAAMQAGKDVYCEKPLARTIAEGRAMVDTARRCGRVCQVGTQQRSDWRFRHVCELVRNGRIGEVKKAVCFIGPNPYQPRRPDEDPPAHLDWDLWLGSASWRPFNAAIHPYNFRYFRDYSGGMLADWGVHLFDIAQWGLGKDDTSPRRVEAEGRLYTDNYFDFPKTMRVQYDFGDVILEWRQGLTDNIEPGHRYGTKFYGTDGEVFVNRSGYTIRPKNGKVLDERIGANDLHLAESHSHHQDFLDCVRTRRRPICDVAVGHRATCLSHLGNIAYDLGHPIAYDPIAERVPGDEAANRLL